MDTLPTLEPLLDAQDVAQVLRVHPETVLRLARAGDLLGLRYARHWRFRKADILSWMERQAALPIPPPPPSTE